MLLDFRSLWCIEPLGPLLLLCMWHRPFATPTAIFRRYCQGRSEALASSPRQLSRLPCGASSWTRQSSFIMCSGAVASSVDGRQCPTRCAMLGWRSDVSASIVFQIDFISSPLPSFLPDASKMLSALILVTATRRPCLCALSSPSGRSTMPEKTVPYAPLPISVLKFSVHFLTREYGTDTGAPPAKLSCTFATIFRNSRRKCSVSRENKTMTEGMTREECALHFRKAASSSS